MTTKLILPLFLDEGAPNSVGTFFKGQGHSVIFLEEALARGSADILVAEVAVRNHAILVAVDTDMRQIAKRYGIGSTRFKRLNLLQLNEHTCKWPIGDPLSKDFYFCGQHSLETGPYCEFHSRRAYHQMDKKRR